MFRAIDIDVDQSTWPTPPNLPAFPGTFHSGVSTETMSIPGMLLMIGYLTAPTSVTGLSLSEFWAWLRYLGSFTADTDLRLTRGFAELDPHQKTILSDDFGMGAPMLWLEDRLSLERIVDGRYFLEYIAASIPALARRTAKRGPNKSPDFVARDTAGVWHVVECKGTQSGVSTHFDQIAKGTVQKHSIIFPQSHTGQRLVGALKIAVHDASFSTTLTITDPPIKPDNAFESEAEDPFEIDQSNLYLAEDASLRSVVAKSLRLSGFEASAETTSSPFGRTPTQRPSKFRRAEEARRSVVDERDRLARSELDSMDDRPLLPELGTRFRGRRLSIDLPRPILIDGQRVFHATVSQGISEEVLLAMRERPTIDTPMTDAGVNWNAMIDRTEVVADGRRAVMKIGEIFRSEIVLS